MASSSITSWQIEGEIVEAVRDFILLVSKITGNCYYSHETERCLLLALTDIANLDSVLRTETLPTEVCLIKAMVFPWLCMDVKVGP